MKNVIFKKTKSTSDKIRESLSSALALFVPQHNCHNHFKYATEDGGKSYIGIFNASRQGNLNLNFEATFEIHKKDQSAWSALLPYPDKATVALNIMKGKPAEVYVRFVNITTELPKLISFKFNENLMCSNTGYQGPRTKGTVNPRVSQLIQINPRISKVIKIKP
ncbi:uncharacterized protein LOC122320759 [Drosophila ficusphila]|uniref:uncharacterized protein LOC122320759 n=1 Tax=Drosophila ficusphila TaxID=30025 RepID=UPI001C8AB0D5|nr:uncharacterized protein LOC122320759 [Drosophila ficusphila]